MLILGIETSGSVGSIAILDGVELIAERRLSKLGRRHAQTLPGELQRLFQDIQKRPTDCQAVAVSMGPGSFTGLRIGVVCAKTLAYVTGCQLAAVDTLHAIAEDAPGDVSRLTVIADAQRGDLYVGQYQRQDEGWERLGSITMHPAAEWCKSVSETEIIAGPGLARWQDELTAKCRVFPELTEPKAATIARIGHRQLQVGEVADLWRLEPYYLRRSSAEEQWDLREKKNL